jgi:hypothetical protein
MSSIISASVPFEFNGEVTKIPVAISGSVESNLPPTIVFPGWSTRGTDRIREVSETLSATGDFGLVYVPEMPHELARKDPRLLSALYPYAAGAVMESLKLEDDRHHIVPHSMSTLVLPHFTHRGGRNEKLESVVVAAGMFAQPREHLNYGTALETTNFAGFDERQRKLQQLRLAVRFILVDGSREPRYMHEAGDSLAEIAHSMGLALKDARNFALHPSKIFETLACSTVAEESLQELTQNGTPLGLVHGSEDPVFKFQEFALRLAARGVRHETDPTKNPNVVLLNGPARGHAGLTGGVGTQVAKEIALMQARLTVAA